jgi:DNA-binding SARP family transcriptional activator
MQYQLLGPVQASEGGRVVDLGPQKQRALLALLVLEQRPVSLARAIDELWDDPPPAASKMVQIYVSGLRKALGPRAFGRRPPGTSSRPTAPKLTSSAFTRCVRRRAGRNQSGLPHC